MIPERRPRVLLVVSTASYRASAFLEAARRLEVDVTVASDRRQALADHHPAGHLTLSFLDPERATPEVREFARQHRLDAVVAADDDGAAVAAAVAADLGLPHHPRPAVECARDKRLTRERLAAAGLRQPRFAAGHAGDDPEALARGLDFPLVVKPLRLAASQGVIRADHPRGLARAWARTARLLEVIHPHARGHDPGRAMLVEEYVPGAEVALEGLVTFGRPRTLAIFEKPDPLEGPFFEETLYVTPHRHGAEAGAAVEAEVAAAAGALGLAHGPVHAEVRLSPSGPVVLEIAPRSIGGLCSRALRFGSGESLEALLLKHALGREVASLAREPRAAGVMMIPIPSAGTLKGVRGQEAARTVAGVEDIRITMGPGSELVPLPEGGRYLGFIFARADAPEQVEHALRKAHRLLTFDVAPLPETVS